MKLLANNKQPVNGVVIVTTQMIVIWSFMGNQTLRPCPGNSESESSVS